MLRGERPIPDDYPIDVQYLDMHVEDVPPEVLERLAAYYGYDREEPVGDPVPPDEEYV
jgi:hypothetical protein